MFTGIRRTGRGVNVWPGYVDALAALLMVVIFVLLIFTLAQFLLRQLVSDQDFELEVLHQRLAALTEELGLTRERSDALDARVSSLSETIASLTAEAESDRATIDRQLRTIATLESDLAAERQLSAEARDEVALLNRLIDGLREQLQVIGQALAAAEVEKQAQAATIEDLGTRLNLELARRVNELERYRSDFFGRVREALGDNPDVRVTGDRFVFQSELLFESGSADLGEAGKAQLARLAETLKGLSEQIPPEVDWVLRIDGHTDRVPVSRGSPFGSNWALATARAVSVVRHLAEQGIPPRRMVAAGFGEHRPLDEATTPDAYQRNRRIEIKLTTP